MKGLMDLTAGVVCKNKYEQHNNQQGRGGRTTMMTMTATMRGNHYSVEEQKEMMTMRTIQWRMRMTMAAVFSSLTSLAQMTKTQQSIRRVGDLNQGGDGKG